MAKWSWPNLTTLYANKTLKLEFLKKAPNLVINAGYMELIKLKRNRKMRVTMMMMMMIRRLLSRAQPLE